jgi:hypothetical protein
MSDSDCSNCENAKCPHNHHDYYNCIVYQSEAARTLLTPKRIELLRSVLSEVDLMVNGDQSIFGIEEELFILKNSARDMLALLEVDISNGGME